ncbi:enoyl-CoA hydratase/isomerase family protein [Paraburkholderia acidisoli]|uniref:Enoyl-CoA hydratase n=1 Tax=Paraburkholderia acidisoli TaxID=2571748 RepID=A0A7Z2GKT4_9BURK|nr:enoyl-CoA hydratase-related protein [Paraburkholderia acidisoli]QGZ63359.1 enoyl-CoA hydratase [Paraburkholderia acidisoli]
MAEGCVSYRSEAGVAIITIDREEKRNAMTALMCDQLREALTRLENGSDRVGILCAAGETFCAGADLTAPPENFWRAVPGIGIELTKPLIAAVQGPVVGMAVGIVAFADLCVAAETTQFIYPEARVGVSKGMIASLVARVPHKVAMELMLLGGPMTAARAYDVGLVNRVTSRGEHLSVALELAAAMATHAPLVMAQLKQMSAQTLPQSPSEAFYLATRAIERVTHSEDAQEGLRAFKEKRRPRFEGR